MNEWLQRVDCDGRVCVAHATEGVIDDILLVHVTEPSQFDDEWLDAMKSFWIGQHRASWTGESTDARGSPQPHSAGIQLGRGRVFMNKDRLGEIFIGWSHGAVLYPDTE